MSRQTDKEEREAEEREAEAKAKAKAKAKEEADKAKADEAKAKAAPKPDQIDNRSDDVESAQKPYPHGNPPDPEDEFEKIHGFRRVKP